MNEEYSRKHFSLGKVWSAMLWRAMIAKGKGYRKGATGHSGARGDRREDKLKEFAGVPKRFRQYRRRYS